MPDTDQGKAEMGVAMALRPQESRSTRESVVVAY